MCLDTNYFKNYFANFQAEYDETSYHIHKDRKFKLFNNVEGRVLEIGPGTGVNFPFLKGKNIEWTGLEPNLAMHPYLLGSALENGIRTEVLTSSAEAINAEDKYFDFVISTEVLCSVNQLEATLSEIKRVLKPNGQFLFLEHVVDKNNFVRRYVQKSVPYTPWRYFSDGCRPGRDLTTAIHEAGFNKVEITEYMQEGEGIIQMINRPHIIGRAVK